MRNGVPFDRLFPECEVLNDYERFAMSVMFSEFEGQSFNWSTMRFEEKVNGV